MKEKAGFRKLHIDNDIWQYKVGKGNVVIIKPDGSKEDVSCYAVTGNYSFISGEGGSVTPKDVKDWIIDKFKSSEEIYETYKADVVKYRNIAAKGLFTTSKKEESEYNRILINYASYLPSPSKMNAHAVLTSEKNSVNKLAAWLFSKRHPKKENPYREEKDG